MRQQVAQGHIGVRQVWQQAGDGIIDVELALLLEHQDQGGRERLRQRCSVGRRLGPEGDGTLVVRVTKSLLPDDRIRVPDNHGAIEQAALVQASQQRIEPAGHISGDRAPRWGGRRRKSATGH